MAENKKTVHKYYPSRTLHIFTTTPIIILSFLRYNYHISENRFFFGKWFTVIFLRSPLWTPRLGLNIFTWRPTLIFLVRAPWGKTAWTCGTTVLLTTPPSGPMAWTSCRILDTIAKYCGKSVVRIRVILLVLRSSNWLISKKKRFRYMIDLINWI